MEEITSRWLSSKQTQRSFGSDMAYSTRDCFNFMVQGGKSALLALLSCMLLLWNHASLGVDTTFNNQFSLGMSLADLKVMLPRLECTPMMAPKTGQLCFDIVQDYPKGIIASFVLFEIEKSADGKSDDVSKITARYHYDLSMKFFESATGNGGFGAPSKLERSKAPQKTSCLHPDKLPEYVHATWSKGTEIVEFWTFTGRTCSAKLEYSR